MPGQQPQSSTMTGRRAALISGLAFPVLVALVVWAIQGGWSWMAGKASPPPQLAVHADEASVCRGAYTNWPKKKVLKSTEQALSQGIPIIDSGMDMTVTLQAETSHAIVVDDIRVKVLENRPLPSSGVAANGGGCGGNMEQDFFDIRLNDVSPSVNPATNYSGERFDFPFKVSASDPESIALRLYPGKRDITFSLTVHWISEGEDQETVVKHDTNRFRVLGYSSRLPWLWEPVGPGQ